MPDLWGAYPECRKLKLNATSSVGPKSNVYVADADIANLDHVYGPKKESLEVDGVQIHMEKIQYQKSQREVVEKGFKWWIKKCQQPLIFQNSKKKTH